MTYRRRAILPATLILFVATLGSAFVVGRVGITFAEFRNAGVLDNVSREMAEFDASEYVDVFCENERVKAQCVILQRQIRALETELSIPAPMT